MAVFPQQGNYHYVSDKKLLLVITYPTPPYLYLRENLRIPAAKPPPVRPRLLMDMIRKYTPGQGITLLKPDWDENGDFEGSDAQERLPKCTPRQTRNGKVSLKDKNQKWIVSDPTGKFLLAKNLQAIDICSKANFEWIYYNDTSFGKDKKPLTLKLGDSYLCCQENGELTLEQDGSEDFCDIKGNAIKYVFLRSPPSPYTYFESAKFRNKYICSSTNDLSRLDLASLTGNDEKIFEFQEDLNQTKLYSYFSERTINTYYLL